MAHMDLLTWLMSDRETQRRVSFEAIGRSGIVVDRMTKEDLAEELIDVYHQLASVQTALIEARGVFIKFVAQVEFDKAMAKEWSQAEGEDDV